MAFMIVKRWWKMRLAVAVSLLGLCASARSEPVITEGFDSGVAGCGVWAPRRQATFTADAAAGKVTVTNLLEQIAVYRYLTLEPGKRYALRFRYKTRDVKVAPGGHVGAGASFNAAGGANGSAGRVALGIPIDAADSDWRSFADEFTVPAGAAKTQLSILGMRLTTGTVWLDDIVLEPIRDVVTIRRAVVPPAIDGSLDGNKVRTPFRIRREAPQFQSLLGNGPGHYIVGSWGIMTAMPGHYPKDLQARFTPALWQQERTNIMTELGEAGMFGTQIQYVPDREVWAARYGMKHWLYLQKFGTATNATYTDPVHHRVDSIDTAYVDAVVKGTRQYFIETPQAPRSLAFALGKDEPMNATAFVFSATRNPKAQAMLETVDKEIKAQFGFGRYGLPDAFAPKPPADEPFRRIAFMRWWNTRFAACTDAIGTAFREAAPGVPYLAANFNHTRSIGDEDVALLAPYTDWVGGDPYPTSTLGLYGRARALYQTGFSTKYLRDVSGGRTTCVTPQAFTYFGQEPAPDDIREWASQALKNGGDVLFWYNEGPSRMVAPAAHKEMLRVCNIVRKLNKLKLPTETRTAVLYSNLSAWGNKDDAKHGWYSLYAILGEEAGTWFRFVSDTQIALGPDALAGCRLLYVPQLKYADAATAARLLAFVEGGGILVVLDPQAFAWSIEGTPLADIRSRLLGGSLGSARTAEHLLVANEGYLGIAPGTRLPLTSVTHREEAGRIMAYDITPPPDAGVFAHYADGAPAAYERQVGKGRVIVFAAQPFGNSELTLQPGPWRDLCVAFAKEAGEAVGLKIWDFELPATGDDVPVTYAVKPDRP